MSTYCPYCTMLSYNEDRCDHCQKPIKPQKEKPKKKSLLRKALDIIDNTIEKKAQKLKTYKTPNETKESHTLTVNQIAKELKTTPSTITTALIHAGFLEKKGKWWIVTDLGQTQGGIQKYNAKTKQKYTLWENDIIENESLIKNIEKPIKTSYKEKVKKGEEYETYIAEIYRSRGYHVTEHGKEKGKKDHGIDLIAKKEKEIILIQCKNWAENGKWKINHEKIKSFQTDARTFVEDKPLLRSCQLTARYIISGDFIHPSAIKHIEAMQEKGKRIDYEIIKMIP